MLLVGSLLLSLLLVTYGADLLVRGASLLALRLGLSPLFIGLTVVGFGTSSPELGASLTATLRGHTDISVGNVVGSNIFNVAFILGATAMVYPISVSFNAVRRDLPLALVAALVPFLALLFSNQIPRPVGGLMVAVLLFFILRAYFSGKSNSSTFSGSDESESRASSLVNPSIRNSFWYNTILIGLGLLLLVWGSRLFVGSAVSLAHFLEVSDLVIGLTVVSIGTSLPELATSVVAALRKNPDLAVGNIIGSNIFNVFGILGVCSLVRAQGVAPQVLYLDAPFMVLTTLALFPLIRRRGVLSLLEGSILLLGYFVYFGILFSIQS